MTKNVIIAAVLPNLFFFLQIVSKKSTFLFLALEIQCGNPAQYTYFLLKKIMYTVK